MLRPSVTFSKSNCYIAFFEDIWKSAVIYKKAEKVTNVVSENIYNLFWNLLRNRSVIRGERGKGLAPPFFKIEKKSALTLKKLWKNGLKVSFKVLL